MLSIIVPTLNSAAGLAACLTSIRREADDVDLVISDAGSTDGTPGIALQAGATLVSGPRGRGRQLRRGVRASGGDWLLFLHSDTVLDPGWWQAVETFRREPANRRRAACFRFALDDVDPRARRVERLVAWRNRVLALPYGDQGLLLSRDLYFAAGGHPEQPLMEDVALVRRLVRRGGRRTIEILPVRAVTSAGRYRRDGWLARPLRNVSLLTLYFLGVPPALLARLYG